MTRRGKEKLEHSTSGEKEKPDDTIIL